MVICMYVRRSPRILGRKGGEEHRLSLGFTASILANRKALPRDLRPTEMNEQER